VVRGGSSWKSDLAKLSVGRVGVFEGVGKKGEGSGLRVVGWGEEGCRNRFRHQFYKRGVCAGGETRGIFSREGWKSVLSRLCRGKKEKIRMGWGRMDTFREEGAYRS